MEYINVIKEYHKIDELLKNLIYKYWFAEDNVKNLHVLTEAYCVHFELYKNILLHIPFKHTPTCL